MGLLGCTTGGRVTRSFPPTAAADSRPPLRLRAIIAVLLLLPGVTLFAVWGDWIEGGNGTAQSLNSFAVATLALFAAANALLRRFGPGQVARAQHHLRALLQKQLRNGFPNAHGSARNHSYFAFKLHG